MGPSDGRVFPAAHPGASRRWSLLVAVVADLSAALRSQENAAGQAPNNSCNPENMPGTLLKPGRCPPMYKHAQAQPQESQDIRVKKVHVTLHLLHLNHLLGS